MAREPPGGILFTVHPPAGRLPSASVALRTTRQIWRRCRPAGALHTPRGPRGAPARSAESPCRSLGRRHLLVADAAGIASGRGLGRQANRGPASCAASPMCLRRLRGTSLRSGGARSPVRRRGGMGRGLRTPASRMATAGRHGTHGSAAGCACALRPGMASQMPRFLSGTAGGAGSAAGGSGRRSSTRIRGRRASTTSSRCPWAATTERRTSVRRIWPATAGAGTVLAGSKWR